METMFMQKFGGTNKEYYGIFESGLFRILGFKFHSEPPLPLKTTILPLGFLNIVSYVSSLALRSPSSEYRKAL